jgi:hypothetical protein
MKSGIDVVKRGQKTAVEAYTPSIDGVLMGCLFRPGFVKVLLSIFDLFIIN